MKTQEYLKNVVTLQLNMERCVGCGMCVLVCPHAVFEVHKGKASILNRDSCMECGACQMNCPVRAIDVDSGVGCAAGIINGFIKGTEPSCDCSSGSGGCC